MAIVEPTIVELCEKVDCRYTLVVEASKRARQLVEINRGLLTYQRDPDLED